MADQNADPSEEYNDDGSKNPDYVAPTDEVESEGDDTENTVTEEEEEEDEEEDSFNDEIDPEKPLEVPTREFNSQHIIARKNKKIEKLKSKLEEKGNDDEDSFEEDEDDEEPGSKLSPEAGEEIDNRVKRIVAPLLGKLASEADEKELQNLFTKEPEAKKYLNHIKAYMSHDAYKKVSPVVIYHHLAFNAAQAHGAKKKQAADFEANITKSGGRQAANNGKVSNLPTAEDIADMSESDFAKMEEDALQGKFMK